MCKEWVKTDCKNEHGKQKRMTEEEEEDQSCDGNTVEDHRRRQREMERINNESGRNYQVTWTPPRKGARGRRRWLFGVTIAVLCHNTTRLMQPSNIKYHVRVLFHDMRFELTVPIIACVCAPSSNVTVDAGLAAEDSRVKDVMCFHLV